MQIEAGHDRCSCRVTAAVTTSDMYEMGCSVERIMAYTNQYDAEAPAKIPGKEPPKQWPQRGVIKVEGLVLKYRPELDPVLKGLTFTVNAREKVRLLLLTQVLYRCSAGNFWLAQDRQPQGLHHPHVLFASGCAD